VIGRVCRMCGGVSEIYTKVWLENGKERIYNIYKTKNEVKIFGRYRNRCVGKNKI
jgi:hypothetical protein